MNLSVSLLRSNLGKKQNKNKLFLEHAASSRITQKDFKHRINVIETHHSKKNPWETESLKQRYYSCLWDTDLLLLIFNIPKSEASLPGQLIWQQAEWSWKVKDGENEACCTKAEGLHKNAYIRVDKDEVHSLWQDIQFACEKSCQNKFIF